MSDTGTLLSTGLLFSAFLFAGSVCLVSVQNSLSGLNRGWLPVLSVTLVSVVGTQFITSSKESVVLALLALATAIALTARPLRSFAPDGRLLLLSHFLMIAWGLFWGIWFVATIPVSGLTRVLLFASYPFVIVTLPISLIATFEAWEVLCRVQWRRPRAPLAPTARDHYPNVSIHVPICSEPPDLVIGTLRAIAQLDYPNFDVLVIDNNTADASLWRPVQAECARLGDRFRFFHLESWPGAKAGALNFALAHTAAATELIAVVDSDYRVTPDFISSLVGYFDDPAMGFVQSPHDYRDWEGNRYLRWCRWESKYFFETSMVSLNERDSAIIVGTMCLIRKRAIIEAGGWSEWCMTEDSELAIRIHAAGYSSVYLTHSFGRGLIPETFAGYKRQRFRWTYGPVQEFQAHLRLFLSPPLGKRSSLTLAQRIHHLNHGLDRINVGIGLALLPLGLGIIGSMLMHRETIPVPFALVAAATSVLLGDFALKWLIYRVMGCSLSDTIGALVTSRALTHTITVASLAALFRRPARWRRTNKFQVKPSQLDALGAARTELLLGSAGVLLAIVVFAELPRSGLLTMFLVGAVYQSLNYLFAPALALLAERQLRRRAPSPGRAEEPAA